MESDISSIEKRFAYGFLQKLLKWMEIAQEFIAHLGTAEQRARTYLHYRSKVWGHTDNLIFSIKTHTFIYEMNCKMNIKYSQDIGKVKNNDFLFKKLI